MPPDFSRFGTLVEEEKAPDFSGFGTLVKEEGLPDFSGFGTLEPAWVPPTITAVERAGPENMAGSAGVGSVGREPSMGSLDEMPGSLSQREMARMRWRDLPPEVQEERMEQVPFSLGATADRAFTVLGHSIEQGGSLPLRMQASIFDFLGSKSMGTDVLEWYKSEDERIAREQADIRATGVGYQLLGGTGRAAAEVPLQLAPGAAVKGVEAAMKATQAAAGVISGLMRYAQERGHGDPRWRAAVEGGETGLINFAVTRAMGPSGTESIFRNEGIKGVGKRLLDTAKQGGLEWAEETVAAVMEDVSDRYHNNPDKTFEQSLKEVLMAGAIGSFVGGGLTGARHGVQATAGKIQDWSGQGTPVQPPAAPAALPTPNEAAGVLSNQEIAVEAVKGGVRVVAASESGAAVPTAVFRGAQGQPIHLELGGATLEQVQALVFRTSPGAEFVGMAAGVPAPIVPAATPTAPEATVTAAELAPKAAEPSRMDAIDSMQQEIEVLREQLRKINPIYPGTGETKFETEAQAESAIAELRSQIKNKSEARQVLVRQEAYDKGVASYAKRSGKSPEQIRAEDAAKMNPPTPAATGAKGGVTIRVKHPSGEPPYGGGTVEVTGKTVKISSAPPEFEYVAYKTARGFWKIAEKTTGLNIGNVHEKTLKAAIARAEEISSAVNPIAFRSAVENAEKLNQPTPPPAATGAPAQKMPVDIESAVRDSNWRGTVREVPAPRSMGREGVKLYIPVDASGKDVSVGGQTILGKTPAEAIELAQKNVKPAPPAATGAAGQKQPWEMTRDSVKQRSTSEVTAIASERDRIMLERRKAYEDERTKLTKKRTAAYRRISRLNPADDINSIDSASQRIVQELQAKIKEMGKALYELSPPDQSKIFDEVASERGYDRSRNELIEHRKAVERAVREGKPVPESVLADYPDLKPTPAATGAAGEKGKAKPELSSRERAVKEVENAVAAELKARNGKLQIEEVPADAEEGLAAYVRVSHPEAEWDWSVFQHEGGWLAENGNGTTMRRKNWTKQDAIDAAAGELREEVGDVRGVFGDNLDNAGAVGPVFESFKAPEGMTVKAYWHKTKWGSWYAEVELDGKTLKLSVRDHEPVRKDMGIPDIWREVSKDWSPREVARALDSIEARLQRLQNATGGPEAASAGIKTPLGGPEAGKGSVSALQPEGASALTSPTQSASPAAVKPADVRPAEPQEQPQSPAQAAPVMQSGLQDFGVKLGGARKDLALSIARDLSDADIAGMSLSEIWPKSEVDAIEDKDMAALAHAVRSMIPSKPRLGYKLAKWVGRVKLAKSLMGIGKERGIQAVMAKMPEYRLQTLADKITLLRGVDRVHWDRIGDVHNYPDALSIGSDGKTHTPQPTAMVVVDGKRRIKSNTLENLVARVNEALSAEGKPEAKMQFEVRGRRDGVGGFFINKAGDPLRRKLKVFETADEAIKFKRDAANYEALAQAWEDIKATDNVKETDVRRAENRPRTGADHRQGVDATPEMFQSTFGFRGVEFGNWVSQGKNLAERQGMLNAAYDALLDLASVVGIPPNAISLNGTLGLGLGSRGHGWASAHYEPGTIVINLTKTRGAGSLGHEWFHALDNYFQRHRNERGVKDGRGDYITNLPETYYENGQGHRLSEARFKEWAGRARSHYALADWKRVEGVRPVVAEAFAELVKVLNASPMAKRAALVDKGKSDGYWSRIIERAARSFENYLIAEMQLRGFQNDYLANVVLVEDFARDKGRYPYLLPEEVAPVAKAFDDLFSTVRVVPEGGVKDVDADAETRQGLERMNLRPGALYFNPFFDPAFWRSVMVSGDRLLRDLGQFTVTQAKWSAAMLKKFGQRIHGALAATWTRLMRLQNQQANSVGAVAQGHLNQIEVASVNANIAEEQKPLYSDQTLAKGAPGIGIKLQPMSRQIAYFGGKTLLGAKREIDVTGALQAAAVKKQSDTLWQQLVDSAAQASPMAGWKLPAWLIGSPRARAFKKRVLHIAARLNATGRDAAGNFTFADFTMRAGTMSLATAKQSELSVGDQFTVNDPLTGVTETLTLGPIITTPEGRVFHQLARPVDGATQAELYQHFAREYPEMIWFLDMFIDPALAGLRQTINGIEVPVFNRFAAAAMMADGNPNFSPLTAYTPDVLVTRSLMGAVRGMWHKAGVRSPGRKYKSGTSREGGHVRDLLSGFNVRSWQMLQEKSRREWMQAVLKSATKIQRNSVPEGWVKLETGMEELWQAVKRLRNWKSPVDPLTGAALFPETEGRMADDGSPEWKAFFGEAAKLRGKQLMLPKALVDQLVRRYVAQVEHGRIYRLGAWMVRNSTQLFLVAPVTVVNNVLTNDFFALEAATRRILSGVANRNMQDLRFARELFTAEFFKWFPGLRTLVDPQWRATQNAGVLPENLFADQTMLADLKVRLDEDPLTYLRQGEIGAAALNFIRYGSIDIRAKTRMAYAWLRAQAVTTARKAGLRGAALRAEVDRYLANPPVADVTRAVEIAGFELLNYADSPAWLENLASGKFSVAGTTVDVGDFGRLVMPFPRFGYHYIAKNAKRAAAVKVLLGKVPKGQRAEAFADLVTFCMWPAGGLGILAAYGLKGLGDDDDEARKRVGTASIKTVDADGNVVTKTLPRDLITSNRINLSAWARGMGLGTEREEDFWLRVRSYPVVAMAGAAVLAWEDGQKFGVVEGARTYAGAVKDLATDFFSVGMAVKVPSKVLNDLGNTRHERTFVDPYAAGVPTVAYVVDQTLDSFLPGTRQFDIAVKWMDPVARRRGASKTLGFDPTVWDAARVGHVTGLLDRVFAGKDGSLESTLPPEGAINRRTRSVVSPQKYGDLQRYSELGGFNVRPINRGRYERALTPTP